MTYLHRTNELCALLDSVASRGFLSYSWSKDSLFTAEETKSVREYMADYCRVLRQIRYPQSDLFSGREQWSASLLEMLSHMLRDSGPEYVSANSQRLLDALESQKEQFIACDFSREMQGML